MLFLEDGELVARRDGGEGLDVLAEYPDGLARATGGAARTRTRATCSSLPLPGYEFADLAGRHHAGGGSHGSLLAGDSEVPMLTIGLGPAPASITGIAPLLLEQLGRGAPGLRACAHACLSGRRSGGRWWSSSFAAATSRTSACSRRWSACRASCSSRTGFSGRAYDDAALPIGAGQTISQPYMVARICEALSLHGTERVLDVGTGSGYQAAVLAELAGEVHTIERIPELAEAARGRLEAAGYGDRVDVHVGDGTLGLPEHAPFGAIAVAAAAPELPPTLYEQLEPRGRLVVPVGSATASSSR